MLWFVLIGIYFRQDSMSGLRLFVDVEASSMDDGRLLTMIATMNELLLQNFSNAGLL